jgi:hypothetical protein
MLTALTQKAQPLLAGPFAPQGRTIMLKKNRFTGLMYGMLFAKFREAAFGFGREIPYLCKFGLRVRFGSRVYPGQCISNLDCYEHAHSRKSDLRTYSYLGFL